MAYRPLEVVYRELWPGVDLIFYGEDGKLKYDVTVQPGARLDDIQFAYRGAERLSLDEEGNLLIHTPYGILIEERPVSYQEIDGKKVVVESRFVVKQNAHGELVYGFEVGHGYHPDYGVVIDPSIAYSTYLGSTSASTDTAAIAVDASGHAYVAGTSGPSFPVTPGAFNRCLPATGMSSRPSSIRRGLFLSIPPLSEEAVTMRAARLP
ncbi:SBBP repeat-containing protein [Paenibacillus sp. MSJ-34]|uniref:DUF7948 domain-containing protein n=1 Tax=Paenibacillus sp. MSJ-34 TaxID=2841529 RepID=UPI001C0FC484|nr:SBBP repeat-containing protein [Paenibacillus sp. MSJ-34]